MKASDANPGESINTYSTGGGGTVLEHRYGALLLTHVLTRKPLPALGDHITPTRVRFQASPESPVDDLLIFGTDGFQENYRLSIGVRHHPQLTKRNKPSVKLIETYMLTLMRNWHEIESGRWRLALAVMASSTPANQLKALTQAARGARSDDNFRTDLAQARRFNPQVKNRLIKFDEIVSLIAERPDFDSSDLSPSELTWRLLANLAIIEPRLEGADHSDRTAAVERLMAVTPDGTAASADSLYSRLAEKVGDYAPSGARVDHDSLCADLRGFRFFAQPDDDELRSTNAAPLSPGVRAEALTLGPIEALPGLAAMYARAEEALSTDPASAAQTYEQVWRMLEANGFMGHASLLRQGVATKFDTANQREIAAEILIEHIEQLIERGIEQETFQPAHELERIMQDSELSTGVRKAGHAALILQATAMHPFSDLQTLTKVFDSINEAAATRRSRYALVLIEAAIATGQTPLVAEREKALTDLANSEIDELTAARIRIAVAEACNTWSPLVKQAKNHRIRRPLDALILARYARHLTLTAEPDKASEYWLEAIHRGALAEIGDDSAEWLYALRTNSFRYGPVTAESETHPLAQAMRLSGGSISPRQRDHYSDALGDIHNGKLRDACESARRALRDAVTYAHFLSEEMAAELLADIYAAAGETARAANLYIRTGRSSEKLTGLMERAGDDYIDVTHYLDSQAPWQRRLAYMAITAQADLIEDDHVSNIVDRALEDYRNGAAGLVRQYIPRIEVPALETAAILVERATIQQAQEMLDLLEPLIAREPNHYNFTDKAHVRALAETLSRDDQTAIQAAQQLISLLALNATVSQDAMELAGDAIATRKDLFKDALIAIIDTSFTAAWLLSSLEIMPPANSTAVDIAYRTLTEPYAEAPGNVSMGTPVGHNAQLVRHLSQNKCETVARAQLARAKDRTQPALNRWNSIDALRVISKSVESSLRQELFEAGVAFAQGSEDGSALDEMTGQAHPLARFRISLGPASLVVPGIQLAAAAVKDDVQREIVESLAVPLLASRDEGTINGTFLALVWLGNHPAALPASALATHPAPAVRSLAAVRWARQENPDISIGMLLANDSDHNVRISLANILAQQYLPDDLLMPIRARLAQDARYSVRKASRVHML